MKARIAFAALPAAAAHGWITHPMSRVELVTHHYQDGTDMPDDNLRYCPSCTCGTDSCGTDGTMWTKGIDEWQKWYDGAGVSVPELKAGEEVDFSFTITADHGGQAWMMLSCNDTISEDNIWYIMNRAPSDTRGRLPSNPAILGWPMATNPGRAKWVVPDGFSCPKGRGVGRWVWKTSNSCNDIYNLGRSTEQFKLEEFLALGGLQLGACTQPCEEFLTCFDFTTDVGPAPPAPPPTPPPPPPMGHCHAISPMATDDWCEANCHYVGSICPTDLCECGTATTTTGGPSPAPLCGVRPPPAGTVV